MILSFINIRYALSFQHFPRDIVNANEWKIMFDPSIQSTNSSIQNILIIFQSSFYNANRENPNQKPLKSHLIWLYPSATCISCEKLKHDCINLMTLTLHAVVYKPVDGSSPETSPHLGWFSLSRELIISACKRSNNIQYFSGKGKTIQYQNA